MNWRLPLIAVFVCSHCLAGDAKIVKVLPHLVDLKGRHALSPSLYERDAYQVHLREHPKETASLRFDVQWKSGGQKQPLKLRIEIRGGKSDLSKPLVVETEVLSSRAFAKWSAISLEKKTYEELGDIIAWRATLWNGEEQVAEQRSFLW